MSAYNEGDVISPVIQHLVENGVDVYLLDNRSTDDTVKQASRWLGRGLLEIETFPGADDDRYSRAAERYDWTAILLRKEELARTLEADWFLHHDADEIRESPLEGVTLKDAIRFVDSLDYNCIDFRIFDFPPVDDDFRQGPSVPARMSWGVRRLRFGGPVPAPFTIVDLRQAAACADPNPDRSRGSPCGAPQARSPRSRVTRRDRGTPRNCSGGHMGRVEDTARLATAGPAWWPRRPCGADHARPVAHLHPGSDSPFS